MPSPQRAPVQPFNDAKDYQHITLFPVESSQLRAVGYDAARNVLAAQFLHGAQAIYHYPNVTPDLHAAFLASDSKGAFFGKHIQPLAFSKFEAGVLDGQQDTQADTITTIAALLHLRELERRDGHITEEAQERAKAAGILIVCGASDDLAEFYGSWRDEAGCYDGGKLLIDATGVLPSWEQVQDEGDEEKSAEYHVRKRGAREVEAVWCPKDDAGNILSSWAYKTEVPHVTFDIMEDGELYCRGIVLAVADLAKA